MKKKGLCGWVWYLHRWPLDLRSVTWLDSTAQKLQHGWTLICLCATCASKGVNLKISTNCAFLVLCVTRRLLFNVVFCLAGCVPGRDPQRNTTQKKPAVANADVWETTTRACWLTQGASLHRMPWASKHPWKKEKKITPCNSNKQVMLNQQICVFSVF